MSMATLSSSISFHLSVQRRTSLYLYEFRLPSVNPLLRAVDVLSLMQSLLHWFTAILPNWVGRWRPCVLSPDSAESGCKHVNRSCKQRCQQRWGTLWMPWHVRAPAAKTPLSSGIYFYTTNENKRGRDWYSPEKKMREIEIDIIGMDDCLNMVTCRVAMLDWSLPWIYVSCVLHPIIAPCMTKHMWGGYRIESVNQKW